MVCANLFTESIFVEPKLLWNPSFETFNLKSVHFSYPVKCMKSSPVRHFFLENASHYAGKMHCKSCLMLCLSCNWYHFHREVFRHPHTLVHVHTQAMQSVDSLKYRPASADVRPVWVAVRWSVSDLSVCLQKTIPHLPQISTAGPGPCAASANAEIEAPGLGSHQGPAVELPWQTAKYLRMECFIHSKRPTPWLPLSKVNLPGNGNLVQYICTSGS